MLDSQHLRPEARGRVAIGVSIADDATRFTTRRKLSGAQIDSEHVHDLAGWCARQSGPSSLIVHRMDDARLTSVRQAAPTIGIVVLVDRADGPTMRRFLAAGATTVLPTVTRRARLARASLAAAYGESVLPVEHLHRIVQDGAPAPRKAVRLRPDQRRLLRWLAEGKKVEAIAQHSGWSVRTIHRRIVEITAAVGATSKTEAIAVAVRHDLIEHAWGDEPYASRPVVS